MGNISQRIARLEGQFGEALCICASSQNAQPVILVVEKEWSPEQIELAEKALCLVCPTHGLQKPPIVRLSSVDAIL